MRVCVVGGGAREHALASVLGRTADVVVVPGNPGIPGSLQQRPEDVHADLFVIGPEQPLVDGLADRLRAMGRLVFGPGADGARLEGSKAYMKTVLNEAGVATARHATFSDVEPALEYLETLPGPWVVKTDGLAAGKGVLVAATRAEAEADVRAKLSGLTFGGAGRTVVIEEGLQGLELTVLAVCDGRRAVTLTPARDYKRVGDADTGPNTGGMGAFSPVPDAPADLVDEVMHTMIEPTLDALRSHGISYRGVLYAGLMLTTDGPKLIEYNVRFGDPEAQVVLPGLVADLAALLAEAASGEITTTPLCSNDALVTVVCAAEGYPEAPRTGDVIEGIEQAQALDGVEVFCAAVATGPDGRLVTAGGRVLSVTGRGATPEDARARAYAGVGHIAWPGMHHRTDIGAHAAHAKREVRP